MARNENAALKEFSSTGWHTHQFLRADASAYLAMFKEMDISWGSKSSRKTIRRTGMRSIAPRFAAQALADADARGARTMQSTGEADRGCAPVLASLAALILLASSPAAIATASPVSCASFV